MTSGAHVLLVDDHAVVRRGVREILAETLDRANFTEAATASETLHHLRSAACDLVVLDLSLPDRPGLDVLKEIKHLRPDCPVLILSVHSEDQFALRTLQAGAAGYLAKETVPEALAGAVRKALAGGTYVSPSLGEALAARLSRREAATGHERLSDREFQVLRMIAEGVGNKQIGGHLLLSPKTVSTYRSRILEKLGLRTNAEIVRYAIEHRMVQPPAAADPEDPRPGKPRRAPADARALVGQTRTPVRGVRRQNKSDSRR